MSSSRGGTETGREVESSMPRDMNKKQYWKSLAEVIEEARNMLVSDPLYVVAGKEGYVILDTAPELGEVGFRINLDGSATLIFTDHEMKTMSELHGRPSPEPNSASKDVPLEEDPPGN
jgi:hypothetical protein